METMHIMKMNHPRTLLVCLAALVLPLSAGAQLLDPRAFSVLDLDRPGLETVKASVATKNYAEAAQSLLEYYRERTGITSPEIPDPSKVKASRTDLNWANDALEHTFFVHQGYQPSFNYGEDIDWQYWPVKDNELRWQLHRHKWFTPMGRVWRTTGEEKYAREWVEEYMDWIKKNPLDKSENARFAWRPLEVSHRVQDQIFQFQLFLNSENFTPAFLTQFLLNYHRHADYLINHYTDKGNHLLFEAQRILFAGTFFPEFKDAEKWRKSGVEVLNREIGKQVYPDGCQFELCPHYHLAAIEIFRKALAIATLNGFPNVFPQSYKDTVEKMIVFYANICYPDYTNPCFSDAKLTTKKEVLPQYRTWAELFPGNAFIRKMASDGSEGAFPDYLCRGFLDSGFFVFRNSWGGDAIQMVVKAGPPGEWHCQPDNGTFELWYNGKTLFEDSGSYVYGGDAEILEQRNWFRRTASHNTLTLNEKNLETTDSHTLLWQADGDTPVLVTENSGYKGLRHRRSIFFVDRKYFVIVDEAAGAATGVVNLNWQMPKGKIDNSRDDMHFASELEGNSNFYLRVFGPEGMSLKKEEGWASKAYMEKTRRMHILFNARKDGTEPVRYVSVLVPKTTPGNDVKVSATIKSCTPTSLKVQVKVDGKKKKLSYSL